MKHGQGGFTLIELLIVVAIIGILAAIAIPRYQNYVQRSEVSSALATIRGVQTGVEDFVLRGREMTTNAGDDEFIGVDASQAYGWVTMVQGVPTTFTSATGRMTTPVKADASGAVSLFYSFTSGSLADAGAVLAIVRDEDGNWSCVSEDVPTAALPDNCN
ncbi:MAG: pilin [Candidatus Viridilinea halotolerans]|uniref:Pilin n=1 Tax=Candidatus Viridilinea halotolerans TaxID=2491704 RepID=A0A426U914_9CHLR|nr:MAG: pilin [Candidatus Viridilinea halotolerans]